MVNNTNPNTTLDTNKPSIILYGGTFNPIHQGHLQPVIEASNQIKPERLIYLPCHLPPHKSAPEVTAQDRLHMTQLALAPYAEQASFVIEVDDFELMQPQTSYTRHTVQHFANRYPNHQLYFLIGMDSLLHFHLWFKWQEILQFVNLLVLQRPNYQSDTNEIAPEILAKTQFINTALVDISSTELRAELRQLHHKNHLPLAPNSQQQFIPASVQDFIKQRQLYQ